MRRGKQNAEEVIVLFSNKDTRDLESSYARNLAPYRDSEGRPTAGIRFDIPDHLSGIHRTLLQYGHRMWLKHNKNPEFKRNVRHDDTELSYCLDIKLPGKQKWITISYQMALADRRASTSTEVEKMGEELSTAGMVVVANDNNQDNEEEQREHQGAPGSLADGGSISTVSWRAPNMNK